MGWFYVMIDSITHWFYFNIYSVSLFMISDVKMLLTHSILD